MNRSTSISPAAGRIAELTGDRALDVKTQALFRPAGEEVESAAHAPEEFLASAKQRELPGREQTCGHQLVGIGNAVDVFGDPEQRIEVAKTPLAFLDVGLDEIARCARFPHSGFAFGELRGDEFGRCLGDDLLVEPDPQRLEQRLVAGDEPRLDDRRADRHVGARLFQALIDCSRRVANLEPQVPEHIEQRLDDLLHSRGRLVRHEEQDIDVRIGREHAAAITADRDNRRQRTAR